MSTAGRSISGWHAVPDGARRRKPSARPTGATGAITVDPALLRRWPLPTPGDDADKRSRGSVVIVAGSAETPGAALLAGVAAMRAGAGKATLAVPRRIAIALGLALPEARVVALAETKSGSLAAQALAQLEPLLDTADAILVGPGLAGERAAVALARGVARAARKTPLLLDAAALALARRHRFERPPLLTPHAGEMAHLLGVDKASVDAAPQRYAAEVARQSGAIVALKGAQTFICLPDGRYWQHDGEGLVGLAASGSGDVLAGLIVGAAARCGDLAQAAVWGVYLHSAAARQLTRRQGRMGYMPSQLSAELPALLRRFE